MNYKSGKKRNSVAKWLCAIGIFGMAIRMSGQGLINFNNRVTSAFPPPVDAPIYDDSWGPRFSLSGTDPLYRAALLGGPTSARATTGTTVGTLSMLASPVTGATWVTFRTGTLAGYVAVGSDSTRDTGLPYGSMGLFQVVAWHGTETTWSAAYIDSRLGLIDANWSAPLLLTVTTGPSDLNVPNLIGLQSFAFPLIPEPSVGALAAGFLGMLFVWRNRKRFWQG